MKPQAKVSKRAIFQRLNRVLEKEGDRLKKAREVYQHDLGEFFLIDIKRNVLIEKDVDIEALGREKGVLQQWEALAKD